MLGAACVSPRRTHADDSHRRQRQAGHPGLSRRDRDLAALAFLLLIAWPSYEYAYDERFITTPALQITNVWRASALPVGISLMAILRIRLLMAL